MRIKEWGGGIEMVDVSFLGRLLLLPYYTNTRAQKKLYRTRMSVFSMEQKNPAPKCWWGEEATTSFRELLFFFFYSEIAQHSGSDFSSEFSFIGSAAIVGGVCSRPEEKKKLAFFYIFAAFQFSFHFLMM
jgi:hypothetical protein